MALERLPDEPGVLALRKTYLATIHNAVGSSQYRNLYVRIEGQDVDILRNGNLSCAYFVTSLLRTFELIDGIHTWVHTAETAMRRCGWIERYELTEGAVLIYQERQTESGEHHKHIGFYIGNFLAISHADSELAPMIHHFTEIGRRTVESVLWHPSLAH